MNWFIGFGLFFLAVVLSVKSENMKIELMTFKEGINQQETADLQFRDSSNFTFQDWVKAKPEQDDPEFVRFVKENYIFPSNQNQYNQQRVSKQYGGHGYGSLEPFTKYIKNGTFFECGAYDGKSSSPTLRLERNNGWNGLLIEADPVTWNKLKRSKRRATLSPACLSPSKLPQQLNFYRNRRAMVSNSLQKLEFHKSDITKVVDCIPLYTILLAYGNTNFDFFSLDVELMELNVLRTIPFDKVMFKIMLVEYNSGRSLRKGEDLTPEHKKYAGKIKALLKTKGYHFKSIVGRKDIAPGPWARGIQMDLAETLQSCSLGHSEQCLNGRQVDSTHSLAVKNRYYSYMVGSGHF